jgi:SOS-response transcriptional repressor LexA
MISLTPAQHLMAWCIQDLTQALGRAPTLGELAAEFDTGKNTIHRTLDALEARGWLRPRLRERPGCKTRCPIELLGTVAPLPDCEFELLPNAVALTA